MNQIMPRKRGKMSFLKFLTFLNFLTLKNVLNDQVALSDDNQQCNVRPREQTELLHVILLHQRQNKPNEADAVQAERQESMVCDEESEGFDAVKENAEVIEETFSVEEVVGSELRIN
jgi:hypothetical protein